MSSEALTQSNLSSQEIYELQDFVDKFTDFDNETGKLVII